MGSLNKTTLSILVLLLFRSLAVAQDSTDAIRQLEAEKRTILSRVRTLVSDSKIRYDTAGRLSGKWRPGQWTWHSHVEVTKIELKSGILKIKANRLLMNYSRGIHKFTPVRTRETVEVEIQTSPKADGSLNIESEWNKAFLRSTEPYPEGIQPYWKPFIDCLINPKTDECQYYEKKSWEPDVYQVKPDSSWEPQLPDVYKVGGEVSEPKVRSRVQPVYTPVARQAGIEGTVLLGAIVKKDGRIEIIRVIRPLGFGLEESAAEALGKWTFQPATRLRQPVNVSVFIEINFDLRR